MTKYNVLRSLWKTYPEKLGRIRSVLDAIRGDVVSRWYSFAVVDNNGRVKHRWNIEDLPLSPLEKKMHDYEETAHKSLKRGLFKLPEMIENIANPFMKKDLIEKYKELNNRVDITLNSMNNAIMDAKLGNNEVSPQYFSMMKKYVEKHREEVFNLEIKIQSACLSDPIRKTFGDYIRNGLFLADMFIKKKIAPKLRTISETYFGSSEELRKSRDNHFWQTMSYAPALFLGGASAVAFGLTGNPLFMYTTKLLAVDYLARESNLIYQALNIASAKIHNRISKNRWDVPKLHFPTGAIGLVKDLIRKDYNKPLSANYFGMNHNSL